jgi:hypothetical protein
MQLEIFCLSNCFYFSRLKPRVIMLLSSLGVQVLARGTKTTAKILNACSITTKSWRRMYSINYKNRYLINISKLEEEEEEGKELGGYSPHPSVIIRKKIWGGESTRKWQFSVLGYGFPTPRLLCHYHLLLYDGMICLPKSLTIFETTS